MRYVTHLESAIDGTHFDAQKLQTTHQNRPLWVRYDLERLRKEFPRHQLTNRPPDMFRYRELLPVGDEIFPVTLGEGSTPLLTATRLGSQLGIPDLWVKDESQLPTGSFKSRGMAMAISMARHFGVSRVAVPSAGNAGGAMAAYACRAGLQAVVIMPVDTPPVNLHEADLCGACTFLVNGLINDCGKIVRAGSEAGLWFELSTLREPYRLEGKKTMGLELAEQLEWSLPDVIVYPTGGGTGLIAMWKAFQELQQLGWLASPKLPRMVAVQSDGCAPIVKAWQQQTRFATPFPAAKTLASGIRVPELIGDFMVLDTLRQSNGTAVAVPEDCLSEFQGLAVRNEGISICPEAAACVAAVKQLSDSQWLGPDQKVVVLNTGAAQKYPPLNNQLPPVISSLDELIDLCTLF